MNAVIREDRGNVALLRLNRPEVRNAANEDVASALEHHLDDIEASQLIRAVVIAGEGKGFCAGTDLKEMLALGHDGYRARVERMHALMTRIRQFRYPTIAAVHGAALGGGTELAAACTFRVAASNAKFGLPEILLGVMPIYGGTQFVTRLIGEGRALDLMLTGRAIDAEEAHRIGLVNRIADADTAIEGAIDYAGELTRFSLLSQDAIRRSIAAVADASFDEGMAIERSCFDQVFTSEDAKEGVTAFLEKRQPVFKDC